MRRGDSDRARSRHDNRRAHSRRALTLHASENPAATVAASAFTVGDQVGRPRVAMACLHRRCAALTIVHRSVERDRLTAPLRSLVQSRRDSRPRLGIPDCSSPRLQRGRIWPAWRCVPCREGEHPRRPQRASSPSGGHLPTPPSAAPSTRSLSLTSHRHSRPSTAAILRVHGDQTPRRFEKRGLDLLGGEMPDQW